LVASAGEVNHIRAVLADEVGNLELYTARSAIVEIDGRKAGTADDTGRLLIRNVKAGRRNLRIFAEGYHERKDEVWIESGETLTSTLDLDAAIRLDAASGALPAFTLVRTLLGFPANHVSSVAFTADGKWVMAGNDGGGSHVLRIWETTTGREVRALYDDRSTVGSILCAPDLAWCASQHSTQGYPSLRVWDPNTGKEQRRFQNGEQGEGGGVEWVSPDGKRLLVSHFSRSDDGARYTLMLDTSTWSPLFKVPHEGGAMNPNASVFVTMGETIQFWDARTGKKVPSPISAVGVDAQFSPDGRWLAVQDANGQQIQVWEVATGCMGPRLGTKDDDIYSFAFSPDGRFLVTTGREVVIWDFATTSPIQRLGFGSAVAVSPGRELDRGGRRTNCQALAKAGSNPLGLAVSRAAVLRIKAPVVRQRIGGERPIVERNAALTGK
jgi:WD40 repeat protein